MIQAWSFRNNQTISYVLRLCKLTHQETTCSEINQNLNIERKSSQLSEILFNSTDRRKLITCSELSTHLEPIYQALLKNVRDKSNTGPKTYLGSIGWSGCSWINGKGELKLLDVQVAYSLRFENIFIQRKMKYQCPEKGQLSKKESVNIRTHDAPLPHITKTTDVRNNARSLHTLNMLKISSHRE